MKEQRTRTLDFHQGTWAKTNNNSLTTQTSGHMIVITSCHDINWLEMYKIQLATDGYEKQQATHHFPLHV